MASQESDADGPVEGINVTPLVDIMLVLLIVFMVTATFASQEALKVNLPKVTTSDGQASESLTVTLMADGSAHLMDVPMSVEALQAQIKREAALNPGVRVMLLADESLPYRSVVRVVDALKGAGVSRLALAAEK